MKRAATKNCRRSAVVALLLLTVATPWVLADSGSVQVHMSPGQITFRASGAGGSTIMRVSCADGTYLERHSPGINTVSFVPIREDGRLFAEGRCKYEFRANPPIDREAVEAAYWAGDNQRLRELWEAARAQTRVTSGSFEIVGGLIVAPPEGQGPGGRGGTK